MVSDSRHEEQVARIEQAIDDRAHRHHPDGPPSHAKLSPQRVPFRARDPINLRFRPPDDRGRGFYVRPHLAREVFDLILVETDRVHQLV